MAFQLAIAMGIATGAILLRVMGALLPPETHGPAASFHGAFLVVAALALTGLWDYWRLDPNAGLAVSGQRPRRQAPGG